MPVGHKKQVEKNLIIVCQKYLLVAVSHQVVQTEKKEKKKNLLLSKTSHIWRRFSSRKISVFTGVGCVNQNHNKDTMKSKKSMYCVVIK